MIPSFNNILIKGPGTMTNFGIGVFTTESENIIIESIDENNQISILYSGSKNINIFEDKINENLFGISSKFSSLSMRNNILLNNHLVGHLY
ncbi:MAG: hypothetical protein ACPKPY_11845 [Nitrososphaeraceae archaeon]